MGLARRRLVLRAARDPVNHVPTPVGSTHGTTLAKGALVSALALLASNLRGIFTLLIARLLGDIALGTFGVAWAVMDLASKFGTLGLDYRLTALVASSEATGNRAGSRRLLERATRISTAAALATAFVGLVLALAAERLWSVPRPLAWATAVLFLALPGVVVYRVSNAASRGVKVIQHDIVSRGLTDSLVSAGALVVLVVAGVRTLAPALAATAGALGSGFVARRLAARLFENQAADVAASPAPPLVRDAWPVALYDFLNVLIMRLDVVMLGLFVDRAPGVTLQTVGIYAACVEIAGGLRKVSQVFTPILTPVLAEHMSAGRQRDAEDSYAYVGRWMLAVLLPAVAVLALSGGALLRLFGPSFRIGAAWLAVTGAGCALNAFVGLGETILMIAKPRWNAMNTVAAAAAAVGLNLMLIPRFGPLGAALALLLPYALQGVLRGLEIVWLLGWRVPWRALGRPWIAALAALPIALVIRLNGSSLGVEIAAGGAYVACYVAAWALFGLDPADRAIVERLRLRRTAQAR